MRKWTQARTDRWDSDDGCVVKIDHYVEANTSRPWLPHYRGWIAYGPGDSQHNYLGYTRRNSLARIPIKYKTAEAGMRAIDKTHPSLQFYCDQHRHLICVPYSMANLHHMAEDLKIHRCWFHRHHYDIPKGRIEEITARCEVISTRELIKVIHNAGFLFTRRRACPYM